MDLMEGLLIQTNGKEMVGNNNPRNIAIWEAVIKELERNRLIQDRGHKREVFGLTKDGYDIAELLKP